MKLGLYYLVYFLRYILKGRVTGQAPSNGLKSTDRTCSFYQKATDTVVSFINQKNI